MFSKGYKINDRYEIVKTIGEGGMANVYLAIDLILDRKVAIKVLRGDLSGDEKFIRRFEREAWSVSNLSHPNIVEVYDVGEENGMHYIVMEYIEGKTLKQLLKKRESLTVAEVVDIMSQVTAGIEHAHEAYIIHRDIKPQNIMILDSGLIKITDFGIAMALNATALTQTNSVMGSIHYIPPEQANGKGASVKSDIYSMGILMYELLTGSVPFKGDNAVEIALKHMKEKIPSVRKQNPTIPQSVENIIIKATAKNPRNRYDSAKEMHDDLVTCLERENEKRVSFEYPENDFNSVDASSIKGKIPEVKNESIIVDPIKIDNDKDTDDSSSSNGDYESSDEKKTNKVLRGLIVFIVICLVFSLGTFVFLNTTRVKNVKVPDLYNYSLDDAMERLDKLGLKYDVKEMKSEDVETGNIVKTAPKKGTVKKKGSTIILYESTGGDFYALEDFTGKDYTEIKAKLELYGVSVNVEKRDVDDPKEYRDKENVIIDQSPKYVEGEDVSLSEGDTVTLFVPNIVDTYPDMVSEGWTLSSLKAFSDEYGVTYVVQDANGVTIPSDEYDLYSDAKITYQSRSAGDTIIKGITLSVKLDAVYDKAILDDVMP